MEKQSRAKEFYENELEGHFSFPNCKIMNHKTIEDVKGTIENEFPSNWLDPLLSGDTKVIGDKVSCQDIERLIVSIKERILIELEKLKI